MSALITGLYVLGIIMLCGMAGSLLSMKKPRLYPPRKVLQQRALLLGWGGGIVIVIAFISSLF